MPVKKRVAFYINRMEGANQSQIQQDTCINNGCKKKYLASENGPEACCHHSGKPIFHDFKKGWTCCNVIVYDWDDFQKIQGCKVGPHIPKSSSQPTQSLNQGEFYQSQTVQRAQDGIINHTEDQSNAKPVKTIDEFNREQEALKAQQQQNEPEKIPLITPNGKFRCSNKGCNKEFTEEENGNEACKYHQGAPVFHDVKKYWTCCKKETWDWDEFMKLPTCSIGRHIPKFK